MFRKLQISTHLFVATLLLAGVVGCSPQAEEPPPDSDAVTTDPLEIEIPAESAESSDTEADEEPHGAKPS